jgi:hypothetical protein
VAARVRKAATARTTRLNRCILFVVGEGEGLVCEGVSRKNKGDSAESEKLKSRDGRAGLYTCGSSAINTQTCVKSSTLNLCESSNLKYKTSMGMDEGHSRSSVEQ